MDRKPYPGFWQATLLCVLFLVFQLGLSIPVGIADAVFKTAWSRHPAFVAVVSLLSCALTMAVAFRIGRPRAREVFALRPVTVALLGAAAVGIVGAVILLSDLDNLLSAVLPRPKWLAEIFDQMFSAERFPVWSFVLLVVVAPLTEELLFRGLMLRGMLGRYGAPKAVLTVAALFAVVHLNPWQALSAVALGALLGWFYVRTRSLLPPLLGHAVANGCYFSVPFLPFEIPGFNVQGAVAPPQYQPMWFDALGVGLLTIGIWTFAHLTRYPPIATEPEPPALAAEGEPPVQAG
jgi:uncharacterized protein